MKPGERNIKNLAQKLGLSKATVSKALNGRSDVSPATRQKVMAAAKAMDYRPNRLARALAHGKSDMIGVILSHVRNAFFLEIVGAVNAEAASRGFRLTLDTSNGSVEVEREILRDYIDRRVEGIILVPALAHRGPDSNIRQAAGQVPLIILDNELPRKEVPFVGTDFRLGAYLAAQHLIELGHGCIGYLGGPAWAMGARQRLTGFKQAHTQAGLTVNVRWMSHGEFDEEEARERATQLLTMQPEVTAVVCANDQIGQGTLDAVRALGREVPRDVSIVSFAAGAFFTTLDQKPAAIGRAAAGVLFELMGGGRPQPRTIIAPTLVVRNSTAAPRTGRARLR
ncbi:MAG: LacI family DNA-binding transcriptional regulator [Kiritimatiellaeota bacterium]|nr:LacI family DNA-binding transcriptional regulator [Kiritimatiellota bacterium]